MAGMGSREIIIENEGKDVSEMPRQPVVDFDHHSSEFNRDPHAAWQSLREECPVAWSEHYGGYWVVADYEGNHDVLKNHSVFTTERVHPNSGLTIPGQPNPGLVAYPEEIDPPYHGPVRKLINTRLSPDASREMQPTIEYWTTTCIDAVIEAGECDLLYDLTGPVPAYTILDWLGFPHDRIIEAAEIMHDTLGYPPNSERFKKARDNDLIEETLWETCAARRKEPQHDLISWLMTQEVNGEPVDDRTIVQLAIVIVGGGVDTTTSLASSAIVHLDRDRKLRQRLINDPGLIEAATEEFLRVYPPLSSIGRTARQDIDFRGSHIRSGDRVLVSRYCANYDPQAFEHPEEFIVDRFPNRHVSFGLGPHRCVGSHVARLMFQEMMRQILGRMPDYELDEDRLATYPDRGMVNGWTALPARFTPGSRVGATQ
jgi:cytochrome P450